MRYCNCHRPPPLWMRFIFFFCRTEVHNENGRRIVYKMFFHAAWILHITEVHLFRGSSVEVLEQMEKLFATAPGKPKLTLVKKEEPK